MVVCGLIKSSHCTGKGLEVHAKKALHLCLPAAVQDIDELTELNPNVFLLQDKTVKSFPIRCCAAHWLGCSLQC